MKMPNLACLYSQGNDFQKKISSYRKTIIAKIPNLKFVDDRPVFEEDRRRAEAWMRGGMDEERKEMKLIKKEKEAKHWANHDAFLLMVKNAKEEKAAEEASKSDKKTSMKEMMAAAKAEKQAATAIKTKEGEEGVFKCPEDLKETKEFVAGMEKKFERRENELLNDLEPAETVPDDVLEATAEQKADVDKLVDEYNRKYQEEAGHAATNNKEQIDFCRRQKKRQTGTDLPEGSSSDEDEAPELEKVDMDKLERTKDEKKKEWLGQVMRKSAADESRKETNEDEVARKRAML